MDSKPTITFYLENYDQYGIPYQRNGRWYVDVIPGLVTLLVKPPKSELPPEYGEEGL
jgi:hypothetical protein